MSYAWDYEGDPQATDGYTVIGRDESGERAIAGYDSLRGASSVPLADGDGLLGTWLMPREKAEELHDRIVVMDATYWPGFNPTLVRVENRRVVERFEPPEP